MKTVEVEWKTQPGSGITHLNMSDLGCKNIKEWDALVKSMPILNSVPRLSYKEISDNGDWLPPKPSPYPITSRDESYVKERHLAYIRSNYEPRTAQPLPSWIPESEFNLLYDEKLL